MLRRISPLSWLLIVVGLLLLVVGIIYLTTAASDLPSFFPGAIDRVVKHKRTYSKRGIAAIVVAAAAFVGVYYNDFRA